MSFEPTLESILTHQVPDWFHDAKLGIFIHWGLYSVPGWAPLSGNLFELAAQKGWNYALAHMPYAEWYQNTLKFEDSPTREFHHETYGADFSYEGFAPLYNQAVEGWDPDDWATLFAEVGARYVVLTTKHHDGFTLWPTRTPCPRIPNYFATRDLVGDLTGAVRARGLRMGLYYSGGLDWTFNPRRVGQPSEIFGTIVQETEFIDYADAHWRELINRYEPAILWNDIGFPRAQDFSRLISDYYNRVPQGVVNNRFQQWPEPDPDADPDVTIEETMMGGLHYDFVTPEYGGLDEILSEKWETCRGIGNSFAYNGNEGEAEHATVEELVQMLVDVVSKNGNLLLGVGPMADGTIPPIQRHRLVGLGQWMAVNGEAIHGTRPWVRANGETDSGIPVRFTRKGDALYATLLGTPATQRVTIRGLAADSAAAVRLLGTDRDLPWQQEETGMSVTFLSELPESPAHCLRVAPAPGWLG